MFNRFTKSYINSESSFANIMMWKKQYNAQYAIIDSSLVLKYNSPKGVTAFSMPYTTDDSCIAGAVFKVLEHCKTNNLDYLVLDGNQNFVNRVQECKQLKLDYNQMRDFQEYIYLSESLAQLSGKDLHAKKNHVNKFKSLYNYKFVPVDKTLTELCKQKSVEWLNNKYNGDSSAYGAEYTSIRCALDNFEYFNLFGGALFVENELVAYTIGEKLNEDTALVHIEKANINYSGSYATINYEFSNMLKDRFKYLNREEDMGIEGLRKAKMSYRPCFMTDKFKCIITEV